METSTDAASGSGTSTQPAIKQTHTMREERLIKLIRENLDSLNKPTNIHSDVRSVMLAMEQYTGITLFVSEWIAAIKSVFNYSVREARETYDEASDMRLKLHDKGKFHTTSKKW